MYYYTKLKHLFLITVKLLIYCRLSIRGLGAITYNFNPIQDGLFWGSSRTGGGFLAPLPKIRHTYPTMMKLGTVIPYLKKIQKMYKSRDKSFEFC